MAMVMMVSMPLSLVANDDTDRANELRYAIDALEGAIEDFREARTFGLADPGVALENLLAAIETAQAQIDRTEANGDLTIAVDSDGAEMGDSWVTQEDVNTLQAAIDAAQEAAVGTATAGALIEAREALEAAINAFRTAVGIGTGEIQDHVARQIRILREALEEARALLAETGGASPAAVRQLQDAHDFVEAQRTFAEEQAEDEDEMAFLFILSDIIAAEITAFEDARRLGTVALAQRLLDEVLITDAAASEVDFGVRFATEEVVDALQDALDEGDIPALIEAIAEFLYYSNFGRAIPSFEDQLATQVSRVQAAIDAANELLASVRESEDGTNVAQNNLWAPEERIDVLQGAIDALEATLGDLDELADEDYTGLRVLSDRIIAELLTIGAATRNLAPAYGTQEVAPFTPGYFLLASIEAGAPSVADAVALLAYIGDYNMHFLTGGVLPMPCRIERGICPSHPIYVLGNATPAAADAIALLDFIGGYNMYVLSGGALPMPPIPEGLRQ